MSCFSVALGVREACIPADDVVAMVFRLHDGVVILLMVFLVLGWLW